MRKAILIVGVLAVMTTVVNAAEQTAGYLEIAVIENAVAGPPETVARGGCYVAPHEQCQGVVYRDSTERGITVGSLDAGNKNRELEIPYAFSYSLLGPDTVLAGVVYAVRLGTDGSIEEGHKIHIREVIHLGEGHLIELASTESGPRLTLKATLYRQSPDVILADSLAQIIWHSVLLNSPCHVRYTREFFADTAGFETAYPQTSEAGVPEYINYKVNVTFAYPLTGRKYDYSNRVTYSRTYQIDTIAVSGQDFDADLVYTSEFQRDIQLTPGKMLKLIFPPDQPSVRGFDIEDTLVIIP